MLPLGGDDEHGWPRAVRMILYLTGLLWAFAGVAIVADVFMGAIERVTSKKKRAFVPAGDGTKEGDWRTYHVWNDTVANLTLMALGSSAPEILLGVIEIAGNEFYAGDLGPSTIVGSAAFNLFVISAVCVMAIPNGGTRVINDLGVFAITATFSVFAYLWLFFIVAGWTPEVITIPEAILTFLFFPLLVFLAYLADTGVFAQWFQRLEEKRPKIFPQDLSKDEISKLQQEITDDHGGKEVPPELMAQLLQKKIATAKTRATMRSGAIRHLTGGQRIANVMPGVIKRNVTKVLPLSGEDTKDETTIATINFKSQEYVCWENCTSVTLEVELRLQGPMTRAPYPVAVNYRTLDGTAKAEDADYVNVREATIVFNPGESLRPITMTILDDKVSENEEEFFVELFNAQPRPASDTPKAMGDGPKALAGDAVKAGPFECKIGAVRKATVRIIDDDGPGILRFKEETISVPSLNHDEITRIEVQRSGGSAGRVTCKFKTESDSAIEIKDFDALDGTLVFEEGQSSAFIEVNIKAKGLYEKEETFRIILSEPDGGVVFDTSTDGGSETCIVYVVIKADDASKAYTETVYGLLISNYDKMQVGNAAYIDQFKNAILPGAEEGEEPSTSDWLLHVFTVFWKLLFACIPPTDYCDGWLCFFVSLIFIGGVTCFIGDLASLLGCVLELPDAVTAISFVALGTSLPDTFASKAAAIQDKYADASIGNVTGSNSVNVFLGIGISWTVGAIYWATQDAPKVLANGLPNGMPKWLKKYKGKYLDVFKDYPDKSHFAVKSGDLGFSVIVFCTCALVCIATLMVRRRSGLGELGGPAPQKQLTGIFFVALWLIYIGLSTWKIFDELKGDPCWKR